MPISAWRTKEQLVPCRGWSKIGWGLPLLEQILSVAFIGVLFTYNCSSVVGDFVLLLTHPCSLLSSVACILYYAWRTSTGHSVRSMWSFILVCAVCDVDFASQCVVEYAWLVTMCPRLVRIHTNAPRIRPSIFLMVDEYFANSVFTLLFLYTQCGGARLPVCGPQFGLAGDPGVLEGDALYFVFRKDTLSIESTLALPLTSTFNVRSCSFMTK